MTCVAIGGVAASGNMGGVAMLQTAIAHLSSRIPNAHFYLLSVTPEADRQVSVAENVTIVPASPLFLIGVYLPISILLWPFWRRGYLRSVLSWIPYFHALRRSSVFVDLSGIAFVDGRGPALLLYNLAVFLPAIATGVAVVKLSQALGPFKKKMNRWAALFSLSRCSTVVARGETSFSALLDLGLNNVEMLPDVTFCLTVPADIIGEAEKLLREKVTTHQLAVLSMSEVVRRYMQKSGRNFEMEMVQFIGHLRSSGFNVLLLPHSFGKRGSKNDDVSLNRSIYDLLPASDGVWLIDNITDPLLLRAIIGNARLFVGSRFHSVVGALAMGVPSLTIGWSHKYREMAALLGIEQYVLDYSDFTLESACQKLDEISSRQEDIRRMLQERLVRVRDLSERNFDVVTSAISDPLC